MQSVAAGLLECGASARDRPALSILPFGRGNDLARSLGLERGEDALEDGLWVLASGVDGALDVGRAAVDGESHVFVNALGRSLSLAVPKRMRAPTVCSALWDDKMAARATTTINVTPAGPMYLLATVA